MNGTPYDFFVQWHLTEKCNLRCRHCYQRGQVTDLTREEIYGAMDNICTTIKSWADEYNMEMSPGFQFTGGEPLLRPELFEILDRAAAMEFSTSLMSNGTLLTRETARLIRETGVSDVQVSLDGRLAVHDRIRG